MAAEQPAEQVEQEKRPFESCIRDAFLPEGAVLTGYVIVYETVEADSDTTRYLSWDESEGLTPWARTGMLQHAMELADGDPEES